MFHFAKKLFHIAEAMVAEIVFGFPTRKIKVIGVTGTDGKTTTTHLLYHILQSVGYKTGMISSIYADTGGKTQDTGFHTTTPRPYAVRKFLKAAVDHKCSFFVLETTSHALDQGRVWGIPYVASVITNVTHEHSLHHKGFEDYINTKTKLLLMSKTAYLNKEMKVFKKVKRILHTHNKSYMTYTTKLTGADYVWPKEFTTKLPGNYNKQNIMAAYSVALGLGLPDLEIQKALKSFVLPKGRYDVVYNKKFTVIIDFAHTPNSIDQVLATTKNEYLGKKSTESLVHIFGSASQRDDLKRPMMGESSAMHANKIILTEEDFRNEDIWKIMKEIEGGIVKKGHVFVDKDSFATSPLKNIYTKVENRAEAINLGVSSLLSGDVLVVTGKSHEKSLNRFGKEEPWDEYVALKSALKKYFSITL